MAIEWTEDLAVGITEIDNQHHELFRRIDQLLNACNQGKGREMVGEIIEFLGEYVIEHFGTEESYMDRYNYPGSASHKEQHRQFINGFRELKQRFETDGPGTHIVIITNRVVVDWLNRHIRNVDKLLGSFLKDKL
ncbi:MAG: bacteriohemerythrin [Bacillota bacterium]